MSETRMSVASANISPRALETKAVFTALGSPKDRLIWMNNRNEGSGLEVYKRP